jgi:5,10-methylenetetrahydromethanopterin reductase
VTSAVEFGCGLENAHALEFVRLAAEAEKLGYGTFWVPEDPFYRGAFTLASAIAAGTRSINVGIGVVNPYTRHPSLIAMELAALEEVSGARAVLGIGAGLRDWIEGRLKISYARSSSAMRETVEIVRRLFRGEELTFKGRVFEVERVKLSLRPPRADVPVHLGVIGPRNLEVAGEIANGVLLSVMTSPAYARFALAHLRRGAARAKRTFDGFRVGAYLLASISDDEREAREAVKPFVGALIALVSNQPEMPMFACAGLAQEKIRAFGEAFAEGGPAAAAKLVDDFIIDTFTLAGSPARCRERLAALIEAGVNAPVFFEVPGIPPEKTIRDVHQHLMPHFR